MRTQQAEINDLKLGLLEWATCPKSARSWATAETPEIGLAKQLGNVSQVCQIMGYSRDTFPRHKELH